MRPILSPALEETLHRAGPAIFGSVIASDEISLRIGGLDGFAKLGDAVRIAKPDGRAARAKIVALESGVATGFAFEPLTGLAAGDLVRLEPAADFIFPSDDWLGRIVGPFGEALDGAPLKLGPHPAALENTAPPAAERNLLGGRAPTGFCVFDTLLPLCRGQRLGLFSGSGVGKSTLLAQLTQRVEADVTIVALIGERGREVKTFVTETLGAGMQSEIVVASTADQSPLAKKQGAFVAMALAEHFRDQGKHVLLVLDSLTRFAEAHREVAIAAGEPPSLHAFPPSTFRAIASLVERAGPGKAGQGDITAIFSVLVQGSDMNEPVADMIRGILDGHVVLERRIAERGRFPAVDVSRSVSRSLPGAASEKENAMLVEARSILRAYEDAETIVRAGLYEAGTDSKIDHALKLWPRLDAFITEMSEGGPEESYRRLAQILEETKAPSTIG